MATRTLTQSNLNNNMSGNVANDLYRATHGGSLGGNYVTGANSSGNYTTASGGNVNYHFASPVNVSTGASGSDGNNDNGGKGGTTDKGGSGSYSGSYDTSAYGGGSSYASSLEALLAQQRAAAQAAYDASMARLNSAWEETQAGLNKNRDLTRQRLEDQLKHNEGKVNDDANKSLREAYINYMMNKKNLNQGLSAMGLSGGATESSMAKMYNNYGSSRNNINTTLADNLADLLQEYQNNLSQAEQLHNSQWMDARNNYTAQANALNNALLNNQLSSYSGSNLANIASYANALNNIGLDAGAYTPTTNTLAVNKVNTTSANNMGSVTDYAKWKAMADSLSQSGANTSNIIYQLRQNGAPLDAVYQILGA